MVQSSKSNQLKRKQITLGIVDDHSLFRKGLISLLDEYEDMKVVLEAGDGLELLEKLKSTRPDVILLDIEMPNMNGIEATKAVRKKYSDIKILPLTMHSEEQFVVHLMENGANGFLLKDYGIETIVDAIYSAHETDYYFNEKVSKVMIKKLVRGSLVRPVFQGNTLNDREIEIIRLICQELSSKEISQRMCVSIRTIEGIREKILEKTGARNTVGIVIYAVKHNIID
ncbi:MAG TPA: response regulator transcription factor [Flavobacteriales bacterium]|nr:response regulator transcription factor [Flavobacteriales bacterium]